MPDFTRTCTRLRLSTQRTSLVAYGKDRVSSNASDGQSCMSWRWQDGCRHPSLCDHSHRVTVSAALRANTAQCTAWSGLESSRGSSVAKLEPLTSHLLTTLRRAAAPSTSFAQACSMSKTRLCRPSLLSSKPCRDYTAAASIRELLQRVRRRLLCCRCQMTLAPGAGNTTTFMRFAGHQPAAGHHGQPGTLCRCAGEVCGCGGRDIAERSSIAAALHTKTAAAEVPVCTSGAAGSGCRRG